MVYPLMLASQRRLLQQVSSSSRSSVNHMISRAMFSTQVQEIETFLSGTSSLYAEQMYEQYMEDPASVHPSWKQYFDNLENGVAYNADDYSRPSTVPGKRSVAMTAVSLARFETYEGTLLIWNKHTQP